jgi:natural product precursor
MKTKKFNKKLNLSKNTIANLDNGKMNGIKGGITGDTRCPWTVCEYTKCISMICVCQSFPKIC